MSDNSAKPATFPSSASSLAAGAYKMDCGLLKRATLNDGHATDQSTSNGSLVHLNNLTADSTDEVPENIKSIGISKSISLFLLYKTIVSSN
ncbi:hypothetical protein AVEN_150751-1 [Araneus ventricosus]|uniref:Uncharacterized protein n=1 Tax=Araneus ventricosus TaxID=182803 RepID=A0A4Y2X3I8_ARAVE|nr:hypothetical protein AVEN_150751-1 [Araneus ventricosus]